MMIKLYNTVLFSVLLCTAFSFSCGCATRVHTSQNQLINTDIKKLLVMPFRNITSVYKESDQNHCPLCGKTFITDHVSDKSVAYLTDRLTVLIKSRTDYPLVFAKHNHSLPALNAKSKCVTPECTYLMKSGLAHNADAVLAGYVYRFNERIGTTYSVESPASVAFGIHIIRVTDGHILWSGYFDETQHSLSENLFKLGTFLKRKAKWITAEQMASSALEELLNTLKTP